METLPKPARALSAKQLFQRKVKTIPFRKDWASAIGYPSQSGLWLIYGMEKHGKTHFALKLAHELSGLLGKVMYVSGEEGFGVSFQSAVRRTLGDNRKVSFSDSYDWQQVMEQVYNKKQAKLYRVVIIDNTTHFGSDLRLETIKSLSRKKGLWIFIAHEDRRTQQPAGEVAMNIRKYASVYFRVHGGMANVLGRFGKGKLLVNEYLQKEWGDTIKNQTEIN